MGRHGKKKQKKGKKAAGIAWYSEEDWKEIRDVASDPGSLEKSYKEWARLFERTKKGFEEIGMECEVVVVDAAELLGWCREAERPVTEATRTAFTKRKLRERRKKRV